jgi:ferredoxin
MTGVPVKVTVDRDRCIGSGNCVYWAPASFELDDEGLSVPFDAVGDTPERLRVAADGCPARAITVEPLDSGADPGSTPGDGR